MVGSGVAGLVAAGRLADSGLAVTVVDKGRGVGGRLATRRVGAARLDHGAQFFTVRDGRLARRVEQWLVDGVAREWCRGFHQPPDGHPRYVGATGMTDLAKDLARGLEVRLSTRLVGIRRGAGGWLAEAAEGATLEAEAVVLSAPVPQGLALLGPALPPTATDALREVRYSPTLALLAVLDRPSAVPPPGGVRLEGPGPLSFVADNHAKGISAVPALTVHASDRTSLEGWDLPDAEVITALSRAARPWLGDQEPAEAQLARWRYATPVALHPERCLVAVDGDRPVVFAGDAFGEARVEGAYLSGLAAAGAVLDRITPS